MARWICLLGAALLTLMAVFHGLGLGYVTEQIASTDAADGLKKMVPVLYANTSFNLGLFAVLALLAGLDRTARRPIAGVLTAMAAGNAGLAAYFGETVAILILSVATVLFLVAAIKPGNA